MQHPMPPDLSWQCQVHTQMLACVHMQPHTSVRVHMHAHARALIRTYPPTLPPFPPLILPWLLCSLFSFSILQPGSSAVAPPPARAQAHTHTFTRTHTFTHAHIHIFTHTHTQPPSRDLVLPRSPVAAAPPPAPAAPARRPQQPAHPQAGPQQWACLCKTARRARTPQSWPYACPVTRWGPQAAGSLGHARAGGRLCRGAEAGE